MEELGKKESVEKKESDIIFSKALKAGKRIYYLDVKKNRKDELFLAITESKKIVSGTAESPVVQFEKHKIFLYKEDFDKFAEGLAETIQYIKLSTSVSGLYNNNTDFMSDSVENKEKVNELD